VPGTTRDVVAESINLDGLPVVLWDTAGIRETKDEVEKIGVDFTLRHLQEAEATLLVLDGSLPLTAQDEAILKATKEKKGLAVINKSDLPQKMDLHQVQVLGQNKGAVLVSAKEKKGLDRLKHEMRQLLLNCAPEAPIVLTNVRHKAALQRAEQRLAEAKETLAKSLPAEIVAVDIQEAKDALEEIVGLIKSDDILERIFAKFCIGK
jgi:tRNA modification GTPase